MSTSRSRISFAASKSPLSRTSRNRSKLRAILDLVSPPSSTPREAPMISNFERSWSSRSAAMQYATACSRKSPDRYATRILGCSYRSSVHNRDRAPHSVFEETLRAQPLLPGVLRNRNQHERLGQRSLFPDAAGEGFDARIQALPAANRELAPQQGPQGVLVTGFDPQGLVKARDRLVMARKSLKRNTEIVMRFRQIRHETNHPLKVRDGLIEATLLLAGRAQMDKRLDEIGLDRERLLQARDRFVETLLRPINHAESGMRLGIVGPERERTLKTGHRLVESARGAQDSAQVVVHLEIVRRDSQRLLVARYCRVETPQRLERISKVVGCLRKIGRS